MYECRINTIKSISISLIILLAVNCNKDNPYDGVNNPPHIPDIIFPANDTTKIDVNINLAWSGGDPDPSDIVKYHVYFEANNPDPELVASNLVVNTYNPGTLSYETKYYWQIVAEDNAGDKTNGPVWNFSTRIENNNPPDKPVYLEPANGTGNINIQNAILKWSAEDSDPESILSYDIFLDEVNPPVRLIEVDHPDTILQLKLLDYDTQYYWKIIAKDEYGAESHGDIWNFRTEASTIVFSETFDNFIVGEPPPVEDGWVVVGNPGNIVITDDVYYGSVGKSCKFVDETDVDSSYIATAFAVGEDVGALEFVLRVDQNDDYLGMRLYSESATNVASLEYLGPQISVRGDSLEYYSADLNWNFITHVEPNNWYKIRLLFDTTNKYYVIYVNDELKVPYATWIGQQVTKFRFLYLLTFNNRKCSTGYVDSIKLYSD